MILRTNLVDELATLYSLQPEKIWPVQKGYRNESHVIQTKDSWHNIIIYKDEPLILQKINNAQRTADILARAGLPVRVQTDPRIASVTSHNKEQYAALYNYLPGKTISWEAYTKDHLRAVGIAMAKMHTTLEDKTSDNPFNAPNVTVECRSLLSEMQRYYQNKGVQTALNTKLRIATPTALPQLQTLMTELTHLPQQHVLHMDFVRGNILFAPSSESNNLSSGAVRVSGIIDFEKTCYGPVLFDVARTLAFLLVDTKYKSEEEVRRYFLKSGYQKRGGKNIITTYQVKKHSVNILECLVDFFLLHDVYKFLLHNPYEDLHHNDHYSRTIKLLQKRGRLELI